MAGLLSTTRPSSEHCTIPIGTEWKIARNRLMLSCKVRRRSRSLATSRKFTSRRLRPSHGNGVHEASTLTGGPSAPVRSNSQREWPSHVGSAIAFRRGAGDRARGANSPVADRQGRLGCHNPAMLRTSGWHRSPFLGQRGLHLQGYDRGPGQSGPRPHLSIVLRSGSTTDDIASRSHTSS